ncbi:MAG: hypothetical protein LKJ88_03595 [Bacilli bacterium]|jgi:hypothetical protein|nr:hypothetical protein [Bacilli bacterium]
MDKLKLNQLIEETKTLGFDNLAETMNIHMEEVKILSEDIQQTIQFFDTCEEEEFYYLKEIFVDLINLTKSKELVSCLHRNDTRFYGVDCSPEMKTIDSIPLK